MMRVSLLLLAFFLFTTSACVKQTTVRHSVNFQQGLHQETAVMVLPPEVVVNTLNATYQTERMYNYEYYVEDMLLRELQTAISNKGYPVRPLRKADIQQYRLGDAMIALRQQYEPVISNLYTTPLMAEPAAFTIEANVGKAAQTLGQAVGSNLLVLVDYRGNVKTTAARMKDFTLDVVLGTRMSNNVDATALMVSIIDARTGTILWANHVVEAKNLYESALDNFQTQEQVEIARLKKILERVFEPLPFKSELYQYAPAS